MPVYMYRCENCGVQFDRHQKYDDQPLTRCPECNKKALRKVIAPVGIVFKGSGFYATDHRSPSGSVSRTTSKDKDGESKGGEAKPAAPAVSKPETASKGEHSAAGHE